MCGFGNINSFCHYLKESSGAGYEKHVNTQAEVPAPNKKGERNVHIYIKDCGAGYEMRVNEHVEVPA
jgi:hypothetical protein